VPDWVIDEEENEEKSKMPTNMIETKWSFKPATLLNIHRVEGARASNLNDRHVIFKTRFIAALQIKGKIICLMPTSNK
jgi:hypothetical protein